MTSFNPSNISHMLNRSDDELFSIDLPYALERGTLKLLRPMLSVLKDRSTVFSDPQKRSVVETSLQQHVHNLKDKTWAAVLNDFSSHTYYHGVRQLMSMWIGAHPKSDILLQKDVVLFSEIFPVLLAYHTQLVDDILTALPNDMTLKIFQAQGISQHQWMSELLSSDPNHFSYSSQLLTMAGRYCPNYLIDEVVDYVQDAVKNQQQFNKFQATRGNINQLAQHLLSQFVVNEDFVEACVDHLSEKHQQKMLEMCDNLGIQSSVLTIPVLKSVYEKSLLQQNMPVRASKHQSKM